VLRDHGICSLLNAPIAIDGIVWGHRSGLHGSGQLRPG
jgi:hypothetical protein